MATQRMLIDGEWRESADGRYDSVVNPATGETCGKAPRATVADVDQAIAAANRTFGDWSRRSPAERAAYLRRASDLAMERHEEIGRAITEEEGKPLLEAQGEARKGAEILRYYAEEGERIMGRTIADPDPSISSIVMYQPVGPAAAITPWNYPVELVAWKAAAALAAGCTLVAKPPSLTPLSPLKFLECLHDAGVPAGVLNVVTGPGSTIGRQLAADPRIRKVAFTGSTEVGRQVVEACGTSLKRISLELGGHCPMIVSKKCNLAGAVKAAVRRSFRNMGQICIAINRIYVDREVFDEFVADFVKQTAALRIGNGLTTVPCDLGPMANREGVLKAQSHIEDAVGKGATVACGGRKPAGAEFVKGYFFEPTILTNVNHSMKVMKEETFGPVVGAMPFSTVDEAIALANDTPYGLASYVFTSDLGEMFRYSRELQAGNVAFNNPDAGVINAPYGGWKESGLGYEHGTEGLYEYLRAKHIRIRYA